MALEIIAHRGARLNDGVFKTRHALTHYMDNPSKPCAGREVSAPEQPDFSADAYENSLTAIRTAWLLGYKVETDIYKDGVVNHDRFFKRDQSLLMDEMTAEDIRAINLSNTGKPQDEGNRIATLDELLDEMARLSQHGLKPPPRLQIELKKPNDVKTNIENIMRRIEAGKIEASQIRITSFNYDLLKEARDAMAVSNAEKPEIAYLVVHEALDYAYLDRNADDYAQKLKDNAAETIPLFYRERLALDNELAAHFPELAGMGLEDMAKAVPALVDQYGITEFEKRYESYLALFIGSGMEAGYRLSPQALQDAPFDLVHAPMDALPGVAEAYLADLARANLRGQPVRANAHSVASNGKNPGQLLRAFAILDDKAEFTLDYPEMVPSLFREVLAPHIKGDPQKPELVFDLAKKTRFDGMEFSGEQMLRAAKRYLEHCNLHSHETQGARARTSRPGSRTLQVSQRADDCTLLPDTARKTPQPLKY